MLKKVFFKDRNKLRAKLEKETDEKMEEAVKPWFYLNHPGSMVDGVVTLNDLKLIEDAMIQLKNFDLKWEQKNETH